VNSVKLQNAKINMQKSVAFLYTNNKAAEIKKTIPSIIASETKISRNQLNQRSERSVL